MKKDSTTIELIIGDLVVFMGYTYTPDYVYQDHYKHDRELGIIVGSVGGYYRNSIYRVYWLKTSSITECPVAHLRLAYTSHNS